MKTEKIEINKIIPYQNNARKNDNAVDAVTESIKQCGYIAPIIVDENNIVLAGHTRLKALKKLGYKEADCVKVEGLTEEQKKKYRLLDNKTNELAEWDMDLLKQELEGLDFGDLELDWNITEEEDKPEIIEDDFNEPIPQETDIKHGDVFKLGNHILMCGDSTDEMDVQTLMNGEKADLLFTDPPYNVNINNSEGMTIENDNMDSTSFKDFLLKAFHNANDSLKNGGAFYVWYASCESINFETALEESDLPVREQLIWVKNSFTFGRSDYKWIHEPCLYGWKTGQAHYFINEYNHPTVIEEKIDFKKMKREELIQMCKEFMKDNTPTTIIHEDKPIKNDLHPTMKPLRMCGELIRHSSRKNELVLDLFGGSGSTLMVCEQMNRRCKTMEYDPHYAQVIIDRWEAFTGKKAEQIKKGNK